MPNAQVIQNSHFDELSPDNQTACLVPLNLAAALPPKERPRVIDIGPARYGVPASPASPVNVGRLNDSLTDAAVNLAQRLSLGTPSGVTDIAQAGADLTGLIHNLFDTGLGYKVQPQLQNVPTDLKLVPKKGSQNGGVLRLVEQVITVLPFDILQYCAGGKLAGDGATYKVLTGDAAANPGHQSSLEAGSTGAQLGKSKEEAGRLPVLISQ
jgi:hypothetical protein